MKAWKRIMSCAMLIAAMVVSVQAQTAGGGAARERGAGREGAAGRGEGAPRMTAENAPRSPRPRRR